MSVSFVFFFFNKLRQFFFLYYFDKLLFSCLVEKIAQLFVDIVLTRTRYRPREIDKIASFHATMREL